MERISLAEAKKKSSQKVIVAGFAQSIRKQGGIIFITLREVSGLLQIVVTEKERVAFGVAEKLSLESVIAVTGLVKKEKQAPEGVEISATKIEVLSLAAPSLPIPIVVKSGGEVKESKKLTWRWLELRQPKKLLVFKVWTVLEQAFREYWLSHSYLEIHSPKLMSAPSESGAELFEVKYFKRKAYLAQSPQFYKQMAICSGLEKVFEVGPVFRAEPSFTTRHCTEFTGFDSEFAYIQSYQEVIKEEQRLLVYVFSKVKKELGKEIEAVYTHKIIVPQIPFPQLTIKKAKKILKKKGVYSEKEGDLSALEEKKIGEHVEEELGHQFIFLTQYPAKERAFYHMRLRPGSKLTAGFDLLFKGIEITTGAQREHRYPILLKQAKEHGLSEKSLGHYLSFFKYGCPPHGGFGMGPARIIMKMLGARSIREVVYIYRGVKRLTP